MDQRSAVLCRRGSEEQSSERRAGALYKGIIRLTVPKKTCFFLGREAHWAERRAGALPGHDKEEFLFLEKI